MKKTSNNQWAGTRNWYLFPLVLFAFMLFPLLQMRAEEKILLAFGNQGVPCYRTPEEGIYMDGFAIDNQGNLYFAGGGIEHPVLFCYSQKERKTLYRVSLPDATSGSLCYADGKLYLLEQWRRGGSPMLLTLTQINPSNGKIISRKKLLLPEKISYSIFTDNQVSVRTQGTPKKNERGEIKGVDFKYYLYDLQGQIKRQMNAPYALDSKVLSFSTQGCSLQYIGRYQKGYVFYDACPDNKYDRGVFILVDDQGKEIKRSKELYRQDTGEVMMASSEGNPEEHKKIAGDYLYLLGKKGNSLCINKYSLKELFPD